MNVLHRIVPGVEVPWNSREQNKTKQKHQRALTIQMSISVVLETQACRCSGLYSRQGEAGPGPF